MSRKIPFRTIPLLRANYKYIVMFSSPVFGVYAPRASGWCVVVTFFIGTDLLNYGFAAALRAANWLVNIIRLTNHFVITSDAAKQPIICPCKSYIMHSIAQLIHDTLSLTTHTKRDHENPLSKRAKKQHSPTHHGNLTISFLLFAPPLLR